MLPPASVHAITLRYDPTFQCVHADGPAETRALRGVVGVLTGRRTILQAAQAVLDRTGFGANDFLFRYPHPSQLDPGELPWEGVEVEAVHELDYVPELPFEQLMARALRTFLDGVAAGDKESDAAAWRELAEVVVQIEARDRAQAG